MTLTSQVDVFKTRPQEILHLLYSMYVRIHRIPWFGEIGRLVNHHLSHQGRLENFGLMNLSRFPSIIDYAFSKQSKKKKGKKCNGLTGKEKLEDQMTKEKKKKRKEKKDPMNSKAPFSNQVSSNSLAGITNIERTK